MQRIIGWWESSSLGVKLVVGGLAAIALCARRQSFGAAHTALQPIERMPGPGSPRLCNECGLPGLRQWGDDGFPMSWFYFGCDGHLDVVRLLGDRQDTATILPTTRRSQSKRRHQNTPCPFLATTKPTLAPS